MKMTTDISQIKFNVDWEFQVTDRTSSALQACSDSIKGFLSITVAAPLKKGCKMRLTIL